jgi:hypothetical protein
MVQVKRVFARREGVVRADVETLWTLLTDWGNMEWWGNALEDDGMTVGACSLEGEHGKVPRTKVIRRLVEGSDLPVENRETLFHEDSVCHRLYYTGSDDFIIGVRNYIATWSFDELAGGHTRMEISSTFDVIAPGDAALAKRIVEDVYDMIVAGLNDFITSRAAVQA